MSQQLKWIPIVGDFAVEDNEVLFTPPVREEHGPYLQISIGNIVSDRYFGRGEIGVRIRFDDVGETETAAAIMLYYDPFNQGFISAQLGGAELCSLWSFAAGRWVRHAGTGHAANLEAKRDYLLTVRAAGSLVTIEIDDVAVLSANLPFPLPFGQAGLWFRSFYNIRTTGFKVNHQLPVAFVVMQFTPPYNELYEDVIRPVCKARKIGALRADDTYGPGVIIQDIERQILEADLVIADITPRNPNVYYEVGYAHALRKPTILIAEEPTELPFDVSPFRVLFYENTIAGKGKIEAGLDRHIEAIQSGWEPPQGPR